MLILRFFTLNLCFVNFKIILFKHHKFFSLREIVTHIRKFKNFITLKFFFFFLHSDLYSLLSQLCNAMQNFENKFKLKIKIHGSTSTNPFFFLLSSIQIHHFSNFSKNRLKRDTKYK